MPAKLSPVVAVDFEAELRQVKTMADGTVNVTLNLPEYCLAHAQTMMAWVGKGVRVVAEVQDDVLEEKPATPADIDAVISAMRKGSQ